ncbi:hypothetical protein PoB_004116600 [Plakobranchus ocellatus]|uniref:DUF4780 domain-containing protein n=1 Tax=Plakobranchus ocellatus TaxID=259542 RepID=A0AAV4B2B4_9GAST|nr:hypothetical protein PoB_004116600 [Plakobranchus ocellatus]
MSVLDKIPDDDDNEALFRVVESVDPPSPVGRAYRPCVWCPKLMQIFKNTAALLSLTAQRLKIALISDRVCVFRECHWSLPAFAEASAISLPMIPTREESITEVPVKMSSPTLLLIASENKEQTDQEVYKVVYRSFKDMTVTKIWHDPLEKRRAVVLVNGLPVLNDKVPYLHQQPAFLAWAEKASSLLVKSNDAVTLRYGITDKLKMLFTIKKWGGSPVDFVRNWTRLSLDHCGYFEICFKNGWDATLRASMEFWSVEGKQLTVVPLFPCFEEKLESQIERLIKCKQCINHVNISESEEKMSVEPDASDFDIKDSVMETIQQSQIKENMSAHIQNQVSIMQTCAPNKPLESNKPAKEQMQESRRKDHDVNSNEKGTRAYLLNNTKGIVFNETKGHIQKISNDNYNDPDSFLDPNDLSKSQTLKTMLHPHTVPIHCQNLFLGRLLSKMKREIDSRVDIQYKEDSRIILIHCKLEEGCFWKAAVQATCDSVSKMPTYEQNFLVEEHVNSVIQLRLMQCKLILNCEQKYPRLLVMGEEGRAALVGLSPQETDNSN